MYDTYNNVKETTVHNEFYFTDNTTFTCSKHAETFHWNRVVLHYGITFTQGSDFFFHACQ